MRRHWRASCGAALLCAGVLLLGITLLPAVCWLFVVGIAMILTGYSLIQKYRYR